MLKGFKSKSESEHAQNFKQIPKHKVFALKDAKSESYGPPITAQTTGMFLRELNDGLKDGRAVWAKHPMDFSVFELGEYDPTTGTMYLNETKICIGLVEDLKQQ